MWTAHLLSPNRGLVHPGRPLLHGRVDRSPQASPTAFIPRLLSKGTRLHDAAMLDALWVEKKPEIHIMPPAPLAPTRMEPPSPRLPRLLLRIIKQKIKDVHTVSKTVIFLNHSSFDSPHPVRLLGSW